MRGADILCAKTSKVAIAQIITINNNEVRRVGKLIRR
jgi:hypothetical protein